MKRRLVSVLALFILLVYMCSIGVSAAAGDQLVIRRADHYAAIDFTQMSLADYCVYFVQDINLKYHEGFGCRGSERSSMDEIEECGSLQGVAQASLDGRDIGLDCSSFVYLIGKFFGSKSTAKTSYAWANCTIGSEISGKVNAKTEGFSSLEVGDVIVTMDEDNKGHVLICVGEIEGKMSMVHIGSSYLCKDGRTNSTCCSINPGQGISICDNCIAFIDLSGQYKRFPRIAGVNEYFSDMDNYNSVMIYKPIYDRSLGSGFSGTDYGTGISVSQAYSWILKTGSLKEEKDIIGMGSSWVTDGEPISIVGRNGLGMSEITELTDIGDTMGYGKITIGSVSRMITIVAGYILLLYACLLIGAYVFDRSNTFIDVSLLSVLSFGKWMVVDDDERIKKSYRENGHVYITKTGVIIRSVIVGTIGIAFLSGKAFSFVIWVLNLVYGLFN